VIFSSNIIKTPKSSRDSIEKQEKKEKKERKGKREKKLQESPQIKEEVNISREEKHFNFKNPL
jgi:hypothetical protein